MSSRKERLPSIDENSQVHASCASTPKINNGRRTTLHKYADIRSKERDNEIRWGGNDRVVSESYHEPTITESDAQRLAAIQLVWDACSNPKPVVFAQQVLLQTPLQEDGYSSDSEMIRPRKNPRRTEMSNVTRTEGSPRQERPILGGISTFKLDSSFMDEVKNRSTTSVDPLEGSFYKVEEVKRLYKKQRSVMPEIFRQSAKNLTKSLNNLSDLTIQETSPSKNGSRNDKKHKLYKATKIKMIPKSGIFEDLGLEGFKTNKLDPTPGDFRQRNSYFFKRIHDSKKSNSSVLITIKMEEVKECEEFSGHIEHWEKFKEEIEAYLLSIPVELRLSTLKKSWGFIVTS